MPDWRMPRLEEIYRGNMRFGGGETLVKESGERGNHGTAGCRKHSSYGKEFVLTCRREWRLSSSRIKGNDPAVSKQSDHSSQRCRIP